MDWLFAYLSTLDHKTEINWREEAEAAEEAGFRCQSFDFEAFIDGDFDRAFDGLPDGEGQPIGYRGWILKEEEYQSLEDELAARDYRLLTSTHEYCNACFLPNYFEHIESITPPAVWTWSDDLEEAWEAAQTLGPPPYLLKDHVKSVKEAWLDACFVPEEADQKQFNEIAGKFVELRADRFEQGFVIRPFLPFKRVGLSGFGYPLIEEYRLFFWGGKLLLADTYHEVECVEQDFSQFEFLGQRIDSPFFTVDVARRDSGELVVIELGDGGVSGMPPLMHPIVFYEAVSEALEGEI